METTDKLPLEPSKRRFKPFKGGEGNIFSKDNQPSPELKKKGWAELRAEKHLTTEILKIMLGEEGKPTQDMKDYLKSLVTNAKKGNPKAIDVLSKCLEDEIIKIETTNAVSFIVPGDNETD